MKLGRETVVLVVAPAIFLGAAYVLLFCADGPSDAEVPRFECARTLRPAGDFSNAVRPLAGVPGVTEDEGGAQVSTARDGRRMLPIVTQPFNPQSETGHEPATKSLPEDGARPDAGSGQRSPVQGRIVGPDRQPLRSARVLVTERPNLTVGPDNRLVTGQPLQYEVPLREDGSFAIARQPGMIYELLVQAESYGPVVVEANTVLNTGVVVLQPQSRIWGKISGVDSKQPGLQALAGAAVTLSAFGVADRTTLADVSGNYEFTGVPSGPVVLTASHQGFLTQRHVLASLAPNAERHLDLQLVEGTRQAGQVVTGPEKIPVPGVHVTFEDAARRLQVFSATSDASGHFEATTLEPGRTYLARLSDPSGTFAEMATFFSTAEVSPLPDVEFAVALPEQRGLVVRNAFGEEVAGATVFLSASMSSVEVHTDSGTTDEHGLVVFGGLDPRARVLFLGVHDGFAITTLGPVPIAGREAGEPFEMSMQGALVVEGRTQDPSGAPVGGVTVRVSPATFEGSGQADIYTTSDESGHFSFRALPPQDLVLTTLVGGFDGLEVPLNLASGHVPEALELVLLPLDRN